MADAPFALILSLRADFPTEWAAFRSGDPLIVRIRKEHFPYLACNSLKKIHSLTLYGNEVSPDQVLPMRKIPGLPADLASNLQSSPGYCDISLTASENDEILTGAAKDAYLMIGYSLQSRTASRGKND